MFEKVLIANRGEIAVRVLRACRELGVRTVAVYSDVDRAALHVRMADEAHLIGPAPAAESYLRMDRILDVARESGAEAIHPGYGFLSENPGFAAACADAGVTFIGPPAGAIRALGDKVAARSLLREIDIPVIPGTETGLADGELLEQAERIGFPLFIKAAAGGGGKGMRLVQTSDALARSLEPARREARKAFGDDRVYLEKAIPEAHHVEVQILADTYGNVIHLGERECSIQRRHQKLIEEAPSPTIDEDLRRRLGALAVRAAGAGGYVNAGTVEFLVGQEGNCYFLEMNTRLQVEHPVTESITGVDIVKEQLRVAGGEPLRYEQEDIQLEGWAIECRITAEDPFSGFLPSSGRIVHLTRPGGPGIRVDSGIHEGAKVSLYYDPLLAKLIALGGDRREVILRMRGALREYRIVGLQTSIDFHKRVMESDSFVNGAYDTTFLDKHFSPQVSGDDRASEAAAIAATLLHHDLRDGGRKTGPSSAPSGETRQGSSWKLVGRWESIGR